MVSYNIYILVSTKLTIRFREKVKNASHGTTANELKHLFATIAKKKSKQKNY